MAFDFEHARSGSAFGVERESALAMKIGELAQRTGLSAHTIRYCERIGLLPQARRDRSKQREYDASVLAWIDFIGRLKATGMPIREMLRYARLRDAGVRTNGQRRKLLEEHRERARADLAELKASLIVLDKKIAGYADAETRMKEHGSHNGHDPRSLRARQARALPD
jgi:DNA-binding transcriptional MerR regulator